MQTKHIPDDWKMEKVGATYAIWDENGVQRCGAKTRSGIPCANRPVNGQLRCRMHPGYPVKGKLHPNYKHGKYSDYMPASIRQRMQNLSDKELTDLSENMLLIDVRISQLAETLEEGKYAFSAQNIREQYRLTKASHDDGKTGLFNERFATLGAMIESAANDYESWEELLKWNRERRDMAKTVHQMTVQADGMMPVVLVRDIVLAMAQAFLEVNALQNAKERENAWRSKAELIMSNPIKE